MPEDPKDKNQDQETQDKGQDKREPEGKRPPEGGEPNKKPDMDEVKAQVKEEILSGVSKRLKALFGVESLDELEEAQLKKKGEFEELFQKEKERAEKWKRRFEETLLRSSITAAAAAAGAIDPDIVLGLLKDEARVTDEGKVLVGDSPVEKAIEALLEKKPYLKKASGKEGGGASAGQAGQGSEKERLMSEYEEAKKQGNVSKMLELKRKLAQIA